MSRQLLPLATRVLTGEASGAEHGQLKILLKQPEHRAWFDRVKTLWATAAVEPVGGFDATAAAKRLSSLIRREAAAKPRAKSAAVASNPRRRAKTPTGKAVSPRRP